MQSRRFAIVVTLVVVVAFVVVAVAPAFAATPPSLALHSRLVSSSPKDGATVATAKEVVLTFNEDVNPDFAAVRVKGPQGSETEGRPSVDGPAVSQPLAADLPAGKHTVTYRVVSADGHPVSGTVTFTTTAEPASAAPSATPSAAPSATLSPTAAATPTPAATASVVASPEPTGAAEPVSDGGSGATGWLVVLGVAVLAALGLGAVWRTRRGAGTPAG